MKTVVLQQKEELKYLMGQSYQERKPMEVVDFRNVNTMPESIGDEAALMVEADGYMRTGGYPEIAKAREFAKSHVGTLYDSIFLKDVAKRHNIRKTQELYSLADHLLSNYCNQLTYNEVAEFLGMSSVNTVKKFCNSNSSENEAVWF